MNNKMGTYKGGPDTVYGHPTTNRKDSTPKASVCTKQANFKPLFLKVCQSLYKDRIQEKGSRGKPSPNT